MGIRSEPTHRAGVLVSNFTLTNLLLTKAYQDLQSRNYNISPCERKCKETEWKEVVRKNETLGSFTLGGPKDKHQEFSD